MPPPTNTSFATATPIPSFPYSQTVSSIGAQTNGLWWSFTPIGIRRCVSVFAGVTSATGTYTPYVTYYRDDGVGGVELVRFNTVNWKRRPVIVSPDELVTYYVRVLDSVNPSTPADRDLQFEVRLVPDADPVTDNIFISQDESDADVRNDVNASLLSSASAATLARPPIIVRSEHGAVNADGVICLSSKLDARFVYLYAPDWTEIAVVAVTAASGQLECPIVTDGTDFYIVQRQSGGSITVYRISAAGALQQTWAGLPSIANKVWHAALSVDAQILYYGDATNSPLYRYDLGSSTPLANFLPTPVANSGYDQVTVLNDGTILVAYYNFTVPYNQVVRAYDSAATLLRTLSFAATDPSGGDWFIDRIGVDSTNPTHFWVWMQTRLGDPIFTFLSRLYFQQYRTADMGLVQQLPMITSFEGGVGVTVPDGSLPEAYFGPGASCPLLFTLVLAPACPGTVDGERTDGLPYSPPSIAPCDGSGIVTAPQIGARLLPAA